MSFDERDSAAFMPKCRVIDPAFTWGPLRKPETSLGTDDLLRNARQRLHDAPSAVPEADRGTFAGLASEIVPDYLRSLGITTVELLPIHAFVDDSYLVEKGRAITGAIIRSASSRLSPDTLQAERQRIQDHGQPVPRARASR